MYTQAEDKSQTYWGTTVFGVKGGGGGARIARRQFRMSSDDFVVSGNAQPRRAPSPLCSFGKAILVVARLVLPVIALLIAFAAAYLYSDTHVAFLDGIMGGKPSTWLTWGHLLLPASFFAVHVASRRYGMNYAIAQVVLASCLVAALGVAQAADTDISAIAIPSAREAAAFAAAFFVALLVAAAVFELTRGTSWWTAPFFGTFWAAAAFAVIFYPAAFAGSGAPWIDYAATHFTVMTAAGFALLIPYWIFRPLIRPLPGFGGY